MSNLHQNTVFYICLVMKFILKHPKVIKLYYKMEFPDFDIQFTLLIISELQKILFPLFLFLTHYEGDTEDASSIFYQLYFLFIHESEIFDKIENEDLKYIMNYFFNKLYSLTLRIVMNFVLHTGMLNILKT